MTKRRHKGRQAVLLDQNATRIVKARAKAETRSLNFVASQAVIDSEALRITKLARALT